MSCFRPLPWRPEAVTVLAGDAKSRAK